MTSPAEPRRTSLPSVAVSLAWRAGGTFWAITIGLALAAGTLAPASAWVLRELVNQLTGHDPAAGSLAALAALAVMLGAVGFSITSLAGVAAISCQRRISVAVTAELFAAVNRIQGLRLFERPAFQDDLRLAERAAEEIPAGMTGTLATVAQAGLTIAAYGGILIATWPPIVLLVLAACVPVALTELSLVKRGPQASKAMAGRYRQWYLLRGLLSDPKAVMEVRLLGLGEFFQSRLVRALDEATEGEYLVRRRIAWSQGGLSLAGGILTAAGTAVVAIEAAHGRLTAGDLVMFLAAVSGMQGALVAAVNEAGSLGASLRLLRHYVDVLRAGGDLPVPAPRVGRAVSPLRQGIELRDVWFRYADGDWVLRGVDAKLAVGATVGLVGANGAGKSTLIKLLCRLYDPQRGAICWDDTDLRDLDPAELRKRLAVTFQDFVTYDMTVAENIGIGRLAATGDRPRIAAAAALVDLHHAICALPDGYDTLLSRMFLRSDGAAGTLLSGGQNQRLALARTLMRDDADLMVLDEPSSGVDAEAEHLIHARLAAHRRGRTSLLVSHRLSAVRESDLILVLEAGRIAERGTHDQLMAAGGSYARLFSLQASAYQDERVRPLRSGSG